MRHAGKYETLYVWGTDKKEKFRVAAHYCEPTNYWAELREQAFWMNCERDGNRYYVGDNDGNEVLPSYEELREAIQWDGYEQPSYMVKALKKAGWWV